MMEIWKIISGYETHEVSSFGKVRKIGGSLLTLSVMTKGYFYVSLLKNGKRKNNSIHRLVATSFIPNPENKLEVNHKDGNKKNNNVYNLEWVSRSENMKHCYDFLSHKGNKGISNKRSIKIDQIDNNGNLLKTWDSMGRAASMLKIQRGNISKCCLGVIKSTGGLIFKLNNQ